MNAKLRYRPDIDGLRAVAVLSVIIFHLNHVWLPGGFVGVDIFFVISGYLITSIIYREMKENKFSFQNFYIRRIKRILPVFFVIVLVSLILGCIVMLPNSYYQLGNSALYATIFLSNIYFARQGGYFENSDQYPLLHTWSLSVEEQYYLIWPAILILFFKLGYKFKKMLIIVLLLMIFSFVISQILSASDKFSSWGYFLLPTRAGELLIGSILAFIHSEKNTENHKYTHLASLVGIILIALSLIFINDNSIFPGINSLWPTIGAGLIIYSNQESVVNKFLSLKPIVYIGLISYSLYLWHWPILAFLRYFYPIIKNKLPLELIMLSAILTIILSILSYHFIEQPARRIKLDFSKSIKYFVVAPSAFVMIIIVFIIATGGVSKRFDNTFLISLKNSSHFSDSKSCFNKLKPKCTINNYSGNTAQPILVYGDSHAGQFEAFFKKISEKDSDLVFHFLDSNSCTVARDINLIKKDISRKNCIKSRYILNQELDNYKTIIIAGRWETNLYYTEDNNGIYTFNYIEKFSKFLKNLRKKEKKIIIISQIPKYNIDVNRNEFVTKRLGFNIKYKIDQNFLNANEQIRSTIKKDKNVYFLSFNELLCQNGTYSPYDKNKFMMYRDDDHLNKKGAEILADKFLSSNNYILLKNFISK